MTEMCEGEVFSLITNELSKVKEHVNNQRIQAAAYSDNTKNVNK